MISVPGPLKALLDSGDNLWTADLYTLILKNGSVLRFTSADVDVVFDSLTWSALGFRVDRSKINLTTGTQVDKLTVKMYPTDADMIGGNTLLKLAINGGLDACYIQLDRAFSPGPGQAITGVVYKRYVGGIAPMSGGRSTLEIEAKSKLELLNIQTPHNVWEPPCVNSLYDGGCTLDRAAFTVAGVVSSITGPSFFTNLAAASGYYQMGVITFTSGANDGLQRSVKVYGSSGLVTPYPFPVMPAPGDTFIIYPGCDRSRGAQGCTKFSNIAHFRGFPYIPDPEVGMP